MSALAVMLTTTAVASWLCLSIQNAGFVNQLPKNVSDTEDTRRHNVNN